MRIGYLIKIGGVTIDSEDPANATLISLMTSNDQTQTDYSLDLILDNKNYRYNYLFLKDDKVEATLKLFDDDDDINPIYQRTIFSGMVGITNWNYATAHVICDGVETSFNQDTTDANRVYIEGDIASREALLGSVVKDLIDDYNKSCPNVPISGYRDLNAKGPYSPPSAFEVPAGEHIETIMDKVDQLLQCVHWTDSNSSGQNILYFSDANKHRGVEFVSAHKGSKVIFDSAALNEIGFVTEVIVHGSPKNRDQDDRYLNGTRACWGSCFIKGQRQIRHIDVHDPTCHEVQDCQKRAFSILNYGVVNNVIKPVFVNIAPPVASMVVYTDPAYGIQISGVVNRREIRVSATEGWICTVEMTQERGVVAGGISPDSVDYDGGND